MTARIASTFAAVGDLIVDKSKGLEVYGRNAARGGVVDLDIKVISQA